MNRKLNNLLSEMYSTLGECGCQPPEQDDYFQSVRTNFFRSLDDLVDDLTLIYNKTPEKAFAFIAKVANTLHNQGELPPFPHAQSNEAEISKWMAHAANSDIRNKVHKEAQLEQRTRFLKRQK